MIPADVGVCIDVVGLVFLLSVCSRKLQCAQLADRCELAASWYMPQKDAELRRVRTDDRHHATNADLWACVIVSGPMSTMHCACLTPKKEINVCLPQLCLDGHTPKVPIFIHVDEWMELLGVVLARSVVGCDTSLSCHGGDVERRRV